MQLVATIDTSFENHLSVAQKVQGFIEAFWQKTARIWSRLCEVFPETAAVTPVAVRAPAGLPGYYGGAYDRLSASMPMVSCVECIGADPFPQASTSRRGTDASHKTARAPRPDGEEDTLMAVLRADLIMPALMI